MNPKAGNNIVHCLQKHCFDLEKEIQIAYLFQLLLLDCSAAYNAKLYKYIEYSALILRIW